MVVITSLAGEYVKTAHLVRTVKGAIEWSR